MRAMPCQPLWRRTANRLRAGVRGERPSAAGRTWYGSRAGRRYGYPSGDYGYHGGMMNGYGPHGDYGPGMMGGYGPGMMGRE